MPFFSGIYCESLAQTNATLLAGCMAEFRNYDLYFGIPILLVIIAALFYVLKKDSKIAAFTDSGGKGK